MTTVNAPKVGITIGIGSVTATIPLNKPSVPKTPVTASVGSSLTTCRAIVGAVVARTSSSLTTQVVATIGVGSISTRLAVQNIHISPAIATTSSLPLGGNILIVGFDITTKISDGMVVILGDGVSLTVGGL